MDGGKCNVHDFFVPCLDVRDEGMVMSVRDVGFCALGAVGVWS